jgi:signal transduction histidine kinase
MTFRLPRLRSLQNKLALLFLGITALSFAAVIFVMLPRLETQLEERRVEDLEGVVRTSSREIAKVVGRDIPQEQLNRLVRATGDAVDARLTLLGVQSGEGDAAQFYVISDSNEDLRVAPDLELAERALRGRDPNRVYSDRDEDARVARPIFYRGQANWILIYERPLDETARAVSLVRDRLLFAASVALVVAMIGGFLVARAVARRVGRLEAAARDVAAGRPVPPLPIDSSDELGELTRTFNEMQRQLARVDRARKEFIANASHELRTPIFSLAGFMELLEDEELDDATRAQFLGTMREQVERLQKLSVDLLDLSRLDAGSLEITREEVDLGELARTVATEFRPALTQHRTELDLRVPDGRVEALCDRERVAQIMRILLDNALRHTPEGTDVIVSADRQNGAAEFAVADAGPGIDPGVRSQLFERFYTADAARGSGLGLAIARELAERMDGRIELRSRPGRTVFTLALPIADGE